MAMKPKVAARVAARKQAVGAMKGKGVKADAARKRFYVQTRAAELEAKGVKVDKAKRQELRKKFDSGDVSRKGFYKKGEKKAKRAASTKAKTTTKTAPAVKSPVVKSVTPKSTPSSSVKTLPNGSTVKPASKKKSPRYVR